MLASYPQQSSHTAFDYPQRHRPLQSSTIPSPSASTALPLFYTTSYSTHTPSPSDAQSRLPRQNYFDLGSPSSTLSNINRDQSASDSWDGFRLVTSPPVDVDNSPIRVQGSSPVSAATVAAPSHDSMLVDQIGSHTWPSYDEEMAHVTGAQYPHGLAMHQRVSSNSSNGSGPASPFETSPTQTYIARSDPSLSPSGVDSSYYDGLHSADQPSSSSASFSKPLAMHAQSAAHDSFLAPAFQNYNPQTHDSESTMEAKIAMYRALREQHDHRDDSPAPGFSTPGRPASSVDPRSPATPNTTYGEDIPDSKMATTNDYRPTPKFDRTMTDAYSDELYTPSTFASHHAPASASQQKLVSPRSNVFNERLYAANAGHMNQQVQTAHSPAGDRSPFRQDSPYAQGLERSPPHAKLASAAQLREQQKAEADAQAMRRQEMQTPKTISPKDALLDFPDTDEAAMPLFPSVDAIQSYNFGQSAHMQSNILYPTTSPVSQRPASFHFAPASVAGGIQMPQQYPFIPQSSQPTSQQQHHRRQRSLQQGGRSEQTPEFPAHLTSMESSMSDATELSGEIQKPLSPRADTGTYSCTYHGCVRRFETPAKLQKHKREGHRQAAPGNLASGHTNAGSPQSDITDMTSAAALLRNSQAGPHKCERINPSTGKPCNTIFSRPYDLTRHEDTIHNARKQKVRCHLCTEEKSFSRNDALTRHMRVVHPEVDFGGRRRKHT